MKIHEQYLEWLEDQILEAKEILKEDDHSNYASAYARYVTLLKCKNKVRDVWR